jgi:hypothetical protein
MTDRDVYERFLPIEQRLAAIELNLKRVMTSLQLDWVEPNPFGSPDYAQAREMLQQGNKIGAIKNVRETTGLGLAEAQQVVEQLEAGL